MSKKTFIKGAFILTLAGIVTRILGFFFKIFLSRIIGAEGVGLYQLVMPVCAICYAIGISGFEVAVSRLTAVYYSRKNPLTAYNLTLLAGAVSLSVCIFCCIFIRSNAGFIAKYFFHNMDCVPLIRVVVLSIPFSCIHCIVSGYYIGQERTAFPALSQLSEQIIRIASVYFIIKITGRSDAYTGALSLVIGETGAAVISITCIIFARRKKKKADEEKYFSKKYFKEITSTALPVCGNRTALHGIQCIESTLIPFMLMQCGYTSSEALSFFGIITGMALPIILFPATLTNSISLMLLPSVSKIKNNPEKIRESSVSALIFSLIFGFVCIIFFETAGAELGALCFKEEQVRIYIRIMAWLCPFMFISTTYKSILNALGLSSKVFANNMLSEAVCIIFILVIPKLGIKAYMFGLLLNHIINALLQIRSFRNYISSKSS